MRRWLAREESNVKLGEDLNGVAPTSRVMVVAITASMVAFLDSNIVNLALPATAHDLGGGLSLQQWVVDGYLLALAATILPGGSISDLFGRVPVLRFGLAAFGAGSLLAAAAAWPAMLITARLIQGLGGAFLVPGSLALINSTFDREDRPAAIGTWTAWTSTAFALGPVLGGLAVDFLSWRWIYILLAILVVIGFALTFWLRPMPGPAERARVDVAGAALSAIGLAATVYALIECHHRGWTSTLVTTLLVGLAALLAFVAWERRTPDPMVPLRLFAMRNFAGANLATAFVYGGLTLGSIATALYLQEVAGYPAIVAGLITLPNPIVSFLFARRVGNAANRIGPRVFLVAGPVLAGLGLLLICPTANHFDFATHLLPGRLVLAVGLVLTITPLSSVNLVSVDTARSGIAAAIQNAVGRTSALTAVACVGVIAAGTINNVSFARLLEVAAALYFLGAVVGGTTITKPVATGELVPAELPPGDMAGTTPAPVWPAAPEPQRPPRLCPDVR
jgi:EmrB/QacA subfamily drug resistance transporter